MSSPSDAPAEAPAPPGPDPAVQPGSGAATVGGAPGAVARHARVLAAATFVSRISGFARDAAIGAIFGAAGSAPWLVAWRLPNLMRRLVAEGALTVAFVPLFAGRLGREGPEAARRLLGRALWGVGLALGVATAVAVVVMPAIVGVLAPEWRGSERFDLLVALARWAFPYVLLVSLVALVAGALNAVRRFFVPAVSTVLVNGALIVGAVWLSRRVAQPLMALPWALLVGGALQVGVTFAALRRAGLGPRRPAGPGDAAVRRLLLTMLPAAFGASVHQVTVLISTTWATALGREPVSWLYFADRLLELPLGVLAFPVAMAVLPELADAAAAGRRDAFRETLSASLRRMLHLLTPAAVGLAILAVPIVAVVYQRGRFDWGDTVATGQALAAYALALPAVGTARAVVQAFYALSDTRTPVLLALAALAAFVGLAAAWTGSLGHVGIALAVSAAAWLHALAATWLLGRRVGSLRLAPGPVETLRLLAGLAGLALAASGLATLGAWEAGAGDLGASTWRNVGVLFLAAGGGAAAWFGVTGALGSPLSREWIARALRRRGTG